MYLSAFLYAHKAKYIQKIPEFQIQIFSGSGFFPEFFLGRACGEVGEPMSAKIRKNRGFGVYA